MSVKVISPPLEVRAVFAKNLEPGDILVLGEGETRAEVTKVEGQTLTRSANVNVSYIVVGLNPVRVSCRQSRPDAIYSVEV